MRRSTAAACAYGLFVAALIGCGLDVAGTDFGDYVPDGDGSTDVTFDRSSGDDTGSDVGSDAVFDTTTDTTPDTASDAGSDVVVTDADANPCPTAAFPLCDDDAASCGSNTACAPAVPAGWQITTFGPSAPVSCPTGFAPTPAGHSAVAMFDAAATTCGCGCLTTPGACGATATAAYGATACEIDAGVIAPTSTCTPATSAPIPATVRIVQDASGSSCLPTSAPNLPPADGGAAHLCGLEDAATVCQDHRFCVPLPAGGDRACIAHAGSVACPSGFPMQVATDIDDTRACSCGCSVNEGTCNGRVHLFPTVDCNLTGGDAEVVFDYDGGCLAVDAGGVTNYSSFSYDNPTLVGASCTQSGGLTGGVDASVTTVCCAN